MLETLQSILYCNCSPALFSPVFGVCVCFLIEFFRFYDEKSWCTQEICSLLERMWISYMVDGTSLLATAMAFGAQQNDEQTNWENGMKQRISIVAFVRWIHLNMDISGNSWNEIGNH